VRALVGLMFVKTEEIARVTEVPARLSHKKDVCVLNFRVCSPAGCPPTIMQPFPSASERHIKSNKIYFSPTSQKTNFDIKLDRECIQQNKF
jgi:hypothetical protein